MHEHLNITSNNTTLLRVVLLYPFGLHLPVTQPRRRMRISDNLGRTPRYNDHMLILEQRIRNSDDEALLQERPSDKRPLPDHLFSDVLDLAILVRVLDVHNHRLVSALGPVDVDAVEAELGGVWDGVEGGETRECFGAKDDAVAETGDEVEAVEGGEVKGFHDTRTAVYGREEVGEG